MGPATPGALATPLGLEPDEINAALIALGGRGLCPARPLHPGGSNRPSEWCDRRLLARIHHYTVRRLRAEIEPVAARDFLRFLFDWQRVTEETRLEGPDAVPLPLHCSRASKHPPARGRRRSCRHASPPTNRRGWTTSAWPDASSGRGWPAEPTIVTASQRRYAPRRSHCWRAVTRNSGLSLAGPADGVQPSGRAQTVLDCLRAQGASFFDELAATSGLLRPQVEEALGELVALGLVTSDSFGGLRALLVPSDRRRPFAGGTRRRRIVSFGMEDAGRWALTRRPHRKQRSRRPSRSSNTWRARCCAATASCSGVCSRARPTGCRHGGTCCACIADWRRAGKSVAAASSPASPASNTRCPTRSACCARCAVGPLPANWYRCPARTRSTLPAS